MNWINQKEYWRRVKKQVYGKTDTIIKLKLSSRKQIRLNFHGDELHPLGGAEMGANIKAEAISHLEEVKSNIYFKI